MRLRPGILVCLATFGIGSCAENTRNGTFCQRGLYGLNRYSARLQPNGDLKFGLSKWEGGRHFGLFGLAKRSGSNWWSFLESDYIGDCRVQIHWSSDNDTMLLVDPNADCASHAGSGFQNTTSHFTALDYKRPVTFELDAPDEFFSARAAEGC